MFGGHILRRRCGLAEQGVVGLVEAGVEALRSKVGDLHRVAGAGGKDGVADPARHRVGE